jgi:hypothetical protein
MRLRADRAFDRCTAPPRRAIRQHLLNGGVGGDRI